MTDKALPIDQQRKNDHVKSALAQQEIAKNSAFDEVRFVHQSLNTVDFANISLETHWAGATHALPFYINGMTGGSQQTKQYNQALAILARETGLPMASGSISAALKHPDMADTFTIIRQENPQGFVMANLGAHHSLENAQKAVDLLQADALQIHLNIPQEVVMPEGDRDYSMWAEQIAEIVDKLDVPVIVKETGFGMARETIEELMNLGVKTIDVSGRGGTNFIQIENERRDHLDFSFLADWGQSTPEALLESICLQDQVEVLASGGIQNPYDIVKAIALGAKAVGLSGKFLHVIDSQGIDAGIKLVEDWIQFIRHMLLLTGCQHITDLRHQPLVISGQLAEWAYQRGINTQALANRKQASS